MVRLTHRRRVLLLSLISVLLVTRAGGAHWHLCFDGQEPPVSIHVADSPIEHAADDIGNPHHDQNVDVGLAWLAKHSSANFDLPPLVFAALALWAVPPQPTTQPFSEALAPTFHDFSRRLPPLRGPPTLANS